ncbi:hypothetical protein Ddye_032244 [Dipteronia dyeriana]|uniref:Uncharacterized protein n=1 Tax=Dipteronia dyeriana TaxID=168575 RepID=A0AAD9TKH6_9ROSI|nr:hypothetical protein Ddye_032244 [Dipteronia dyeriana]
MDLVIGPTQMAFVKDRQIIDSFVIAEENGFNVVVGSGSKVRLWQNVKWDLVPLMTAFSRIFTLATNKKGTISEYGNWLESRWVWNVSLRRVLFNWEMDQWNCFMMCLESVKLRYEVLDALAWNHVSSGLFTVKSFRRCLEDNNARVDPFCDFLWQGICPPKVEIGDNESPMCGSGSESIDPLFLHCVWSDVVWRFCMGWWGVSSCSFPSVKEWAEVIELTARCPVERAGTVGFWRGWWASGLGYESNLTSGSLGLEGAHLCLCRAWLRVFLELGRYFLTFTGWFWSPTLGIEVSGYVISRSLDSSVCEWARPGLT